MHVRLLFWPYLKIPYMFIQKYHHQLPEKNPQSTPFFSLYFQNRCNGHKIIYTFWLLHFFHVCVIHPSRGALSIQFIFVNIFTYSWGSINNYITKKGSELWWSFIITILKTSNIHKTCGLSFSSWICPTYSLIFYIISENNINSITICLLIFWIIKLFNSLFWFDTTPIIMNIFFCPQIFISIIKLSTMMYKVKKYLFL